MTGLALGWRWFTRPTSETRGLKWRRVLAAALATWVAILGLGLWWANNDRFDRGLAQQPQAATQAHRFDVFQSDVSYRGDVWTTVLMGGLRAGVDPYQVTPPGVPAFPTAGTAYVSPAVREAIAHDSLAAGRVPGRIVGTIGEAGLQAPDQLLIYAGQAPGPRWRKAQGWGALVVAEPRGSIPRLPLALTAGILVGIPALLLIRATARMAAVARRRSLAACHLLGVPVRTLVTASAFDAMLCAAAGVVCGMTLSMLTLVALHDTQVLGIEWFLPPSIIRPSAIAIVAAAVTLLPALDTARSTRRDLRALLAARAGAPTPTRWWLLTPLVVGVAMLAGALAAYLVGVAPSPTMRLTCLFVGTPVAALGATAGLTLVLAAGSSYLRRRQAQETTAAFVAVRRLTWQRESIAAACVGLTIVAVGTLVGAGMLTDVNAISPIQPGGDMWDVQVADESRLDAALQVPGALRMLEVATGRQTTDIADCATLEKLVERFSREPKTTGALFARQCRPGHSFRIVSDATPGGADVTLPPGEGDILRGTQLVATDPVSATLPPGQRDIIAFPGAEQRDVDDYLSRILQVAPATEVTNLDADPFAPMVAPTRRLFVTCTTAGLVTSVVLLILGAVELRRRGRIDDARLIALGGTQRLTARIHAITFGLGATFALGIGLLVGGLAGTLYDRIGGLVANPGLLGVGMGSIAVAIAALAVLLTWLAALPQSRRALSEELRRE